MLNIEAPGVRKHEVSLFGYFDDPPIVLNVAFANFARSSFSGLLEFFIHKGVYYTCNIHINHHVNQYFIILIEENTSKMKHQLGHV